MEVTRVRRLTPEMRRDQIRTYLLELSNKRLAGIASALMPAEVLDADELVVG